MSKSIHVKYVIFDIYDKFDIHDIGYMSMMNMLIWVSKEASGPQDRSKIPFIKFLNDYSEKISKYRLSEFSFVFSGKSFV